MFEIIKIQRAIKFATKTHNVYQQQKRKGKEIPYITHPLTVGILLSHIGADADVVCAGILHDTIEDSIPEKKVTAEMLEKRFGAEVAQMVLDVTEADKSFSWDKRKEQALKKIKTFSHNSLLVKTADMISNLTELVDDYEKEGEQTFLRFNAPKAKLIKHDLLRITAIMEKWSENPLSHDLRFLGHALKRIGVKEFMSAQPAKIIEYEDYNEDIKLECPICHWKGSAEDNIEYYDDLFDVSCPNCDKMLLIVSYPLVRRG